MFARKKIHPTVVFAKNLKYETFFLDYLAKFANTIGLNTFLGE